MKNKIAYNEPYSFYLFTQLYDVHFPEDKQVYDLKFDKMLSYYHDYNESSFNDSFQSEYTCMQNYFESTHFINNIYDNNNH